MRGYEVVKSEELFVNDPPDLSIGKGRAEADFNSAIVMDLEILSSFLALLALGYRLD